MDNLIFLIVCVIFYGIFDKLYKKLLGDYDTIPSFLAFLTALFVVPVFCAKTGIC